MIFYLPKCGSLLTYYGFKSHVNFTDALEILAEKRIKVGTKEAGTIAFNQVYGEFQENQYKTKTRQILELALNNVCG